MVVQNVEDAMHVADGLHLPARKRISATNLDHREQEWAPRTRSFLLIRASKPRWKPGAGIQTDWDNTIE